MKFIVILFLFLTVGSFTLAQEIPEPEKDYVIQKEKEIITEDSSAFHRINKQYEVGAQLFGFGPNWTNASGLYIGYKIDRNSLLLIESTFGKTSLGSFSSSSNVTASEYSITGSSFGIHFKKISGNSFYWRAGIDYREVGYRHHYADSFFSEKSEFDGQSVVGTFQIGNQWQWENFTLGCDWVGLTLPVTSRIYNESIAVSGTSTLNSERERLDRDQDNSVRKASPILLRFYLGWAF